MPLSNCNNRAGRILRAILQSKAIPLVILPAMMLLLAGCPRRPVTAEPLPAPVGDSADPVWQTPPSATWDTLAKKYKRPVRRPVDQTIEELVDYARAFRLFRLHSSQQPPDMQRKGVPELRIVFIRADTLTASRSLSEAQQQKLISACIELQMDLSLVTLTKTGPRETVSLRAHLLLTKITGMRIANPLEEYALDWPDHPNPPTLPSSNTIASRLRTWEHWWQTTRKKW